MYLVRLDGRNLLILFNVISNLCVLVSRSGRPPSLPPKGIASFQDSHVLFDHCFNVPSEMDSAISGTLTITDAVITSLVTWRKGLFRSRTVTSLREA